MRRQGRHQLYGVAIGPGISDRVDAARRAADRVDIIEIQLIFATFVVQR